MAVPLSVDDLVSRMSTEEFEQCEHGGYECAICLEGDAAAPLKLACSHSFCAACLRSHVLAQLKQHCRYLPPCPLCKRAMRMKEVAYVFASADPKSKNEYVALLRRAQGGELWQEEDTTTGATLAAVSRRVTRGYTQALRCCGHLWPTATSTPTLPVFFARRLPYGGFP